MKTLRALTRKQGLAVAGGFGVLAVVLVLVFVGASGGGSHKKATKKRAVHHTVKPLTKQGRPAPLTGVPDPSGASFKRAAITVKINNTDAVPQYGVDQADVVYEEVVEGGITRLAAIFNSHAPDRVGPVRSVRRTDQSIVWPIGGIFAYSGGAQYALESINTAPVKQLDETRAGAAMYRDPVGYKYMPYNLWARVDQMYAAGATPVPPPSLFTYRKAGAAVRGEPAASFVVGFGNGFATTFTWDTKSHAWLRSKFNQPDVDGSGVRLAPKNVVVMFVQYIGGAGALGAEANLVGTGNAWVFTGGKVVKGTWSRADKTQPAQLTDAKGAEVRLAPGQTWVELPDVSYPVTVTPGRAR